MSGTPCPVKERKVSQSASSKIDSIIRQLFLPMLTMPTPPHTSFLPESSDALLLRQVADDHPEAVATESEFVRHMVDLYRRFSSSLDLPRLVDPEPSLVDEAPPQPQEGRVGLADAAPEGAPPLVPGQAEGVGGPLDLPGDPLPVQP